MLHSCHTHTWWREIAWFNWPPHTHTQFSQLPHEELPSCTVKHLFFSFYPSCIALIYIYKSWLLVHCVHIHLNTKQHVSFNHTLCSHSWTVKNPLARALSTHHALHCFHVHFNPCLLCAASCSLCLCSTTRPSPSCLSSSAPSTEGCSLLTSAGEQRQGDTETRQNGKREKVKRERDMKGRHVVNTRDMW